MEVTIRLAEISDVPKIVELMREYYAFEEIPFDDGAGQMALRQLVSDPNLGLVWVARVAGATVGYIAVTFGYSLEFLGREATVDEFYIRAGHRGRGVGRLLLDAAETACRERGFRALSLEAARDNERAREFYQGHGFKSREEFFLMSKVFAAGEG